mmetsp:Transcript_28355/g.96580  ORF Transcript_28355/g.96580 Transcript_28355/m.96580 type:complete len:365 (+) Transcript_28355:245-1339(+)
MDNRTESHGTTTNPRARRRRRRRRPRVSRDRRRAARRARARRRRRVRRAGPRLLRPGARRRRPGDGRAPRSEPAARVGVEGFPRSEDGRAAPRRGPLRAERRARGAGAAGEGLGELRRLARRAPRRARRGGGRRGRDRTPGLRGPLSPVPLLPVRRWGLRAAHGLPLRRGRRGLRATAGRRAPAALYDAVVSQRRRRRRRDGLSEARRRENHAKSRPPRRLAQRRRGDGVLLRRLLDARGRGRAAGLAAEDGDPAMVRGGAAPAAAERPRRGLDALRPRQRRRRRVLPHVLRVGGRGEGVGRADVRPRGVRRLQGRRRGARGASSSATACPWPSRTTPTRSRTGPRASCSQWTTPSASRRCPTA